jgi:F-type H+-transporting ATPase subunit epsilon
MVDGLVTIKTGDNIEEFAVLGGFMDIGPDSKVTILADAAMHARDINQAKAQEAKNRAVEAMKNKTSEIEFKEAEASLRKALLELKVAGKRRQTRELPPQS